MSETGNFKKTENDYDQFGGVEAYIRLGYKKDNEDTVKDLGVLAICLNEKYTPYLVDFLKENAQQAPNKTHYKRIVGLDLKDSTMGDATLEQLSQFTDFTYLGLQGVGLCEHPMGITDDGYRHVAKMGNLEALDLMYQPITDKGLENLEPLHNLEYLILDQTKVTAVGVERIINANPRLRVLSIEGTANILGKERREIIDIVKIRMEQYLKTKDASATRDGRAY